MLYCEFNTLNELLDQTSRGRGRGLRILEVAIKDELGVAISSLETSEVMS